MAFVVHSEGVFGPFLIVDTNLFNVKKYSEDWLSVCCVREERGEKKSVHFYTLPSRRVYRDSIYSSSTKRHRWKTKFVKP